MSLAIMNGSDSFRKQVELDERECEMMMTNIKQLDHLNSRNLTYMTCALSILALALIGLWVAFYFNPSTQDVIDEVLEAKMEVTRAKQKVSDLEARVVLLDGMLKGRTPLLNEMSEKLERLSVRQEAISNVQQQLMGMQKGNLLNLKTENQ